MKRKIVIIMIASVVICFNGCNNNKKEEKTTKQETTILTNSKEETNEHGHIHAEQETDEHGHVYNNETGESSAIDSDVDAVEKIQSFSMKKLGLDGKAGDYHFMVSTKTKEIESIEYSEVIAAVVHEGDSKENVSIDTKGTYYVSKDGKKCLKLDSKTGKCKELK